MMDAELLKRLSRITREERGLLEGGLLDREIYMAGDSFQVDSSRMLRRGSFIDIRPHTRFTAFPPHSHNYVEITYVCEGSISHVINGHTSIKLSAGEILLLNQHAVHSIERAGEHDVAVNFMIMPEFFDYALELIGYENLLGQFLISTLQKDTGDADYLHFRVSDVLVIQNLVENLIWGVLNKQSNNRRINQVTMGLLFLQLLNYIQLSESRDSRDSHALVMEALKEIEENYKTANLSALAQSRDVSLAYVSRLIRASAGNSFKELLREKRLNKAASLLTSTRLTVEEIIEAVGYDNTSYFYRIFKARYKMSPREYRINN